MRLVLVHIPIILIDLLHLPVLRSTTNYHGLFSKIYASCAASGGTRRAPSDHPIIHPVVLFMACFNIDMQTEPVIARIYGSSFHEGFKDFGWA